MSNCLDPDQARHYVGPEFDPNLLQRLSADDISRYRVNLTFLCLSIEDRKGKLFLFLICMCVCATKSNFGNNF